MPENRPTFGLIGTFGYGNLGDAAIQDAIIEHIRLRFPAAVIYGYSLNPEDTEKRHGIKSFPISRMAWSEAAPGRGLTGLWQRLSERLRRNPRPIVRSLERWLNRLPLEAGLIRDAYRNQKGVNALIVSGGGQLDDYWAGGGPWSHPYTLLKFGLLARLRGARYLFVSVGAGPIDAGLSKKFIDWALSLAQYRSYRDEFSRDLVESIGGPQGDPIYPDLAFSLAIPAAGAPDRSHGRRPLVGIGPIGYFSPDVWPEHDPERYADYLAKMTRLAGWLFENGYAVTYLVGECYYDQLTINDLQRAIAQAGIQPAPDQVYECATATVPELLRHLGEVDFVIASRFHTVLLSQMCGKPVIALSYQAKIDALMQAMGQAEFCFPIDRFETAELIQSFPALVANRAQISQIVSARSARFRAALDEQYERIFDGI